MRCAIVIATICAANYLPKAACLARSLKQTQPKHTFVMCLVERDRSTVVEVKDWFSEVKLACELGIPNFDSFIFRHERHEACRAVKARFLLWAMKRFGDEQNFLYLDPDVLAYSRFEELEALMPEFQIFSKAQIIVTPHQLYDEDSLADIRANTFRALTRGTFNLGFLAIRRSQPAVEFLEWWNGKLQALCYIDWQTRGLFGDQKWAALGISFFDMKVLREPGYNVGNWNVSTRKVALDSSSRYLVNGKPLRFFHFSDIDSGRDLYFFRRSVDGNSPIFEMRRAYLTELESFGQRASMNTPWSYGSFLSGAAISREIRFRYRDSPQLVARFPDPFSQNSSTFYSVLGTPGSTDRPTRRRDRQSQPIGD